VRNKLIAFTPSVNYNRKLKQKTYVPTNISKGQVCVMAGIRINIELCKSCKLCLSACPRKLIEMEAELLNSKGFHPASPKEEGKGKCVGCAFCAIICPHLAIEVDR